MMIRTEAAQTLQRRWRMHLAQRCCVALRKMREMSVCVVCNDECVGVVRCPNGHACCLGCEMSTHDSRCPICRVGRPMVQDASFEALARSAGVRMHCAACDVFFPVDRCEHHRAWCPSHRFVCPHPECTACVTASDMAAHVARHEGVHSLTRRTCGRHHVILGMPRHGGDTVIVCVGPTVVVVTNASRRFYTPTQLTTDSVSMTLQVHAYYPSSHSPPVYATLRQLRVVDCSDVNSWVEEHRYGLVPPMMASRENVVVSQSGPILTPRCVMMDPLVNSVGLFALPDVLPGKDLSSTIRARGVRDIPIPWQRNASPVQWDVSTPIALVHLMLREDTSQSIGDVWST